MPKITKQADNVSVATNTNSLFNSKKDEDKGSHCVQNVNVNIKIDQQEDGLTSCFKAIANLFKRGK